MFTSEVFPRHTTWSLSTATGPGEHPLSTQEINDTVCRMSAPGQVMRILGVDLSRRPDLPDLVQNATRHGVRVQLIALNSDCCNQATLGVLNRAGAAELHLQSDPTDRVNNGDDRDGAMCRRAIDAGIEPVLRTLLHDGNAGRIEEMFRDVERTGASKWIVGPAFGSGSPVLDAHKLEDAVRVLAAVSCSTNVAVSASYAPFFLRVCESLGGHAAVSHDERWGVHVGVDGKLTPDPAIPLVLGNVRDGNLHSWFQNHPVLRALRDPDAVEGKCGDCKYRPRCGGSRARALAQTGNLFASDPACTFVA